MTPLVVTELMVLSCSLIICLRLLFYRRAGASYKRHYSLIAWLVIAISGGLALSILTDRITVADLHPLLLHALPFIATAVMLVRGNVAQLLQPPRWTP